MIKKYISPLILLLANYQNPPTPINNTGVTVQHFFHSCLFSFCHITSHRSHYQHHTRSSILPHSSCVHKLDIHTNTPHKSAFSQCERWHDSTPEKRRPLATKTSGCILYHFPLLYSALEFERGHLKQKYTLQCSVSWHQQ